MNYNEPKNISKENRLQIELASWIYQSHLWKEGGVAEDNIVCDWCGVRLGATTILTTENNICPGNPKIKEMRREWVRQVMKGINEAEIMISKSREGLCQES